MKKKLFIFLLLVCSSVVLRGQGYNKVDFRYAPDWYVTNICLPDDSCKTLVGPLGQLLYDFGGKIFFPYAGGKGFRTVFHMLADEQMKIDSQRLLSPRVPIVETFGTIYGMTVNQETFSINSLRLNVLGNNKKMQFAKNEPREDIVLTTIRNNSISAQTIHPLLVVNSEDPVVVEGQIVIVNNHERLFLSQTIVRMRQNLGQYKTLVELTPISIIPGEEKVIAAIYDNGLFSDFAQKLVAEPGKAIHDLEKAKEDIINYWENLSPVPFDKIFIPDTGIQNLVDASLRNIWQAREVFNGKISFQVGPTVYRGLWIVDGAFLFEAATLVGKGDDARDGIEYMLSFQQPNGKFGKLSPDFWKENGIVLWTCVRHAMLTQDKEWLKSIWGKLSKTVDFIGELRKMTLQNTISLDDGLIPPGAIDGGLGGGKDIAEYTNIYWNLAGLKAVIKAAHWIGEEEDAKEWQKEYDDFYLTFQKAANRDMATDSYGNRYLPIPMDPKYRSLPQRAQWAFCQAVYPGQLFTQDDPIAKGTMNMLHTTLQEGMVMGTGWIIDGIWNYFASFYGHACLWMGDGKRAAESLYAFANHASPLFCWREEHNPRDLHRLFVGDMPHNWASAEFIRLTVHLLALDRGNELHLFEGLPKEWTRAGMVTKLDGIATPFGKLNLKLQISKDGKKAQLNILSLSDSSCEKVTVHLGRWASNDPNKTIILDPKKDHNIEIQIND